MRANQRENQEFRCDKGQNGQVKRLHKNTGPNDCIIPNIYLRSITNVLRGSYKW